MTRYPILVILILVPLLLALLPRQPVAAHAPLPTPVLGEPIDLTPQVQDDTAADVPAPGPPDPVANPRPGSGRADDPRPTATATVPPDPATIPDRCEENDTLVQPCAIPTEIVIDDLTFVDDAIDVYSVLLKAPRTYTVTAASDSGIDPALALYRADDLATVLASNDDISAGDPTAQITVTVDAPGWYVIATTNQAPGDMQDRTYTLAVRSSDPVAAPPDATTDAEADADAVDADAVPTLPERGDVYENNYSPDTAGRLAWGVPYDLSLICPEANQCESGDHDFFWVPVKRNVALVLVTYDLGPGADTTLTLYRPEAQYVDPSTGLEGWRPLTQNDDVVGGFTLRSQIIVVPDWDGWALLVVSPSARIDPPPLPPAAGPNGRYRLMVGPPALESVATVLDAQDDIPPPPPTATPVPPAPTTVPAPTALPQPTSAPAQARVEPTAVADDREVLKGASVTGIALVNVPDTVLYAAAPPTDGDALATYYQGTEVQLLGQSYRGWVKVQPYDVPTSGWMYGPHLRMVGGATLPATDALTTTTTVSTTAPLTATTPLVSPLPGTASDLPVYTLESRPPLPVAPRTAAAPEAREITVVLCGAPLRGQRCDAPLERVQVGILLAATEQPLVRDASDRSGTVTFSVSVPPDTLLLVQVPALGIQATVPARTTTLPITWDTED